MARWISWSERIDRPVSATERPVSLDELVDMVSSTTQAEATVHAQGSRWAFEAPAYCPNLVVDTTELSGFPVELADAVVRPDRTPGRYLVGVAAGTKVRNLYRALAFDNPRGYRGRTRSPYEARPSIPLAIEAAHLDAARARRSRRPVHRRRDQLRHPWRRCGAAAAVRLRQAIVLVAAGGVVYLLEDDRKGEEIVNEEVLSARIGHRVTPVRDADLFEAALVSAGRLGVIWAYVIEVHDETGVAIIETRDVSRWDVVRETLVADARGAATADEFLQVVVEPIGGEPYKAYVTRHSMKAGNPTDEAADPPLTHVARAREQSGAALAFQLLLTPRGWSFSARW